MFGFFLMVCESSDVVRACFLSLFGYLRVPCGVLEVR